MAILTFPLFGALPQKTVLSTVCQLHDWPDGTTLRAFRGTVTLITMLPELDTLEMTRPEEKKPAEGLQPETEFCSPGDELHEES